MTYAVFGYLAGRPLVQRSRAMAAGAGVFVGALTGAFLTALVLLGSVVDLRAVFLNASPDLYNLLTDGLGTSGAWVPIVTGAVAGGLAGVLVGLPVGARNPLLVGHRVLDPLQPVRWPDPDPDAGDAARRAGPVPLRIGRPHGRRGDHRLLRRASRSRSLDRRVKPRQRVNAMPPTKRRAFVAPLVDPAAGRRAVVPAGGGRLLRPGHRDHRALHPDGPRAEHHARPGRPAGPGLRGLLRGRRLHRRPADLDSVLGIAHWAFWAGGPVRDRRRDAVRALPGPADPAHPRRLPGHRHAGLRRDHPDPGRVGPAEADPRRPAGHRQHPQAHPVSAPITGWPGPNQIYYIALACAAVIAFVAWRLRASRLGRSWMAIREDEDVAEAMGINLVQTKLLAYMLGAGVRRPGRRDLRGRWSDPSSPPASSCSCRSTSWRSSSSAAWAASRASSWAPSS